MNNYKMIHCNIGPHLLALIGFQYCKLQIYFLRDFNLGNTSITRSISMDFFDSNKFDFKYVISILKNKCIFFLNFRFKF